MTKTTVMLPISSSVVTSAASMSTLVLTLQTPAGDDDNDDSDIVVTNDTGREVESQSSASRLEGVLRYHGRHPTVGLYIDLEGVEDVTLSRHLRKPGEEDEVE